MICFFKVIHVIQYYDSVSQIFTSIKLSCPKLYSMCPPSIDFVAYFCQSQVPKEIKQRPTYSFKVCHLIVHKEKTNLFSIGKKQILQPQISLAFLLFVIILVSFYAASHNQLLGVGESI